MKILLGMLVVFTMASLSSAQQPQSPADVIFINGDIYLGSPTVGTKPVHPPTQAIAVSGG